jgi:hypothetical protein
MGYSFIFTIEIVFALRSSSGSLNLGISYGMIYEVISNIGPVYPMAPSEWYPTLAKTYASIIPKMEVDDLKDDSKTLCIGLTRYFFGNDILLLTKRSRVPHDGVADAIWLADTIRRKHSER